MRRNMLLCICLYGIISVGIAADKVEIRSEQAQQKHKPMKNQPINQDPSIHFYKMN